MNKKELEIKLSKLSKLKNYKVKLEQYLTPSSLASGLLWIAYMNKDIEGKVVLDPCCGHGIFAVGCCLLNAKRVIAIEIDKEAIEVAKENAKMFNCSIEWINGDFFDYSDKVDTIISNFPFGVKNKGIDKKFLVHSMEIAKVIYSLHKANAFYLERVAKKFGFKLTKLFYSDFPIKKQFYFHKKEKYETKVVACRFEKLF